MKVLYLTLSSFHIWGSVPLYLGGVALKGAFHPIWVEFTRIRGECVHTLGMCVCSYIGGRFLILGGVCSFGGCTRISGCVLHFRATV